MLRCFAGTANTKIRAVNERKASKGKRVSSFVPYGYKKIEGDKEQWYIDEPAAEVVRKIFELCLAGRGSCSIHYIRQKELVSKVAESEKQLPQLQKHSISKSA